MKKMEFLIVGFLIGIIAGIFITSLCVIASDADDREDDEYGKIDY